MGGAFSSKEDTRIKTKINRVPIYTPRHVPKDMEIPPQFKKFDPQRYKDKFLYPAHEPPKYW